jgi:hypothetical protein
MILGSILPSWNGKVINYVDEVLNIHEIYLQRTGKCLSTASIEYELRCRLYNVLY